MSLSVIFPSLTIAAIKSGIFVISPLYPLKNDSNKLSISLPSSNIAVKIGEILYTLSICAFASGTCDIQSDKSTCTPLAKLTALALEAGVLSTFIAAFWAYLIASLIASGSNLNPFEPALIAANAAASGISSYASVCGLYISNLYSPCILLSFETSPFIYPIRFSLKASEGILAWSDFLDTIIRFVFLAISLIDSCLCVGSAVPGFVSSNITTVVLLLRNAAISSLLKFISLPLYADSNKHTVCGGSVGSAFILSVKYCNEVSAPALNP